MASIMVIREETIMVLVKIALTYGHIKFDHDLEFFFIKHVVKLLTTYINVQLVIGVFMVSYMLEYTPGFTGFQLEYNKSIVCRHTTGCWVT